MPSRAPPLLPHDCSAEGRGIDYMMAPPPVSATTDAAGTAAGGAGTATREDVSSVIFVCDTSGSMCVSEPLADGVARKLRGSRTEGLQSLRGAGDAASQVMPHERSGVTYVSRMQAVQAAVSSQVSGGGRCRGGVVAAHQANA